MPSKIVLRDEATNKSDINLQCGSSSNYHQHIGYNIYILININMSRMEINKGFRIVFVFAQVLDFCLVFFPGTICLVFATVWN
jgi:hypothetical protein